MSRPDRSSAQDAAPAFRRAARVLCGLDASRADPDAIAQARALAGRDGHVDFLCVIHSTGAGPTAQASIARDRAEEALHRARRDAADRGVTAEARLAHDAAPATALMAAAEDHAALVVGTHATGRAGGIMLGSVATYALHRSPVPVLVARPASSPALFDSIVVASDGSPASDAACGLAGEVAAGSRLTLATVGDGIGETARRAIARQSVELRERTGREPAIATSGGPPVDGLLHIAGQVGATLLVVGSGGKLGVRALGSVSERVAHRAGCSVLVARHPPGGPTAAAPAA